MNNFFLLNEALNAVSVPELELGILNLNSIQVEKDNATDVFMKHQSIWEHPTRHGLISDFYFSIISKETRRLVPKIFESIRDYDNYIGNEHVFDGYFPQDCNGFLGINFSGTTIPVNRQITELIKFNSFKRGCALAHAYDSIQDFWNNRALLFPNLIFCEGVWEQIENLAIADDRFDLIKEKLTRLNSFTGNWTEGVFDYKNLGLDNSPDTPKRIKDTIGLRTFNCPGIGNRVFSLHIKWSFGRQFFRLYYFPNEISHNVYVGYIGPKDDIGFS